MALVGTVKSSKVN